MSSVNSVDIPAAFSIDFPMDRSRKRRKRHRGWRNKEASIRALVRDGRYLLGSHAYDKIAQNYWTLEDVITSIATGQIQKVQKDEDGTAIDGNKYIILGNDENGCLLETVGKIICDDGNQFYFVITCF